jgi:hypothetical protein
MYLKNERGQTGRIWARRWEIRNAHEISLENVKRKYNLKELKVDGDVRVSLKIRRKCMEVIQVGRTGPVPSACKYSVRSVFHGKLETS